MAEQGRAGQSWAGRIAAVIVVMILIIGGYFALTTRPGPKPEQAVNVAVVPPAAKDAAPASGGSSPPASPAPGGQAAAPAGSAPSASAASPTTPAAPSFDVVRVEPSGEAVVAGLAPPNSTVEVMDGATAIAKGTANDRGEWALTVDKPLAPGSHDLSIRTTSSDKKTETLSEQSVAVDVPANPKAGPLVVLNSPDAASKVIQVPAAAEPADGSAAAGKPAVTVDAVEFQDGKLFISGSAAIGGTVRIYVDGVVVGDATADENGRWQIEAKGAAGTGKHTIRADGIDKASGNVLARAEVPFEQNGDVATLMTVTTEGGGSDGVESASNVPAPKSVIIRRGDNLWTISKRLYGHGIRFSTIYEANNDQIRDPNRIYPGQVFVLPAGDARWTQ
ncbi:Ig-like domain (group 3) [Kaistia soli DSM 19436]|uniref:Ig-like domain (Group 3) n=1 Tax=Kaistia soli DSM 19436 TaxID=1122133 RepID=A0A1M5NJK0_9HYPH|nr:LysM peptidoglycan-binding domain-containing protein [Kaistia soli]SHG89701.1 Ig-like domain (group 3) [Kaistia soli DSM 19436]